MKLVVSNEKQDDEDDEVFFVCLFFSENDIWKEKWFHFGKENGGLFQIRLQKRC